MNEWKCCIVEAAKRASDCCGFNLGVIRRWVVQYTETAPPYNEDELDDECITNILSCSRGQHKNHAESLINDKSFCLAAREFVRSHACRKGEPNLTGYMLVDWMKEEYNVIIHVSTARRWLHKLGFDRVHHQKGVYFDGHDREDVVSYRKEFLDTMHTLDKKSITCIDSMPSSPLERKH